MCFRCGSKDNWIADFLKLGNTENKVQWNIEKPKTRAYRLKKIDIMLDNSKEQSGAQKIYVSMVRISSNAESLTRDFGDILQMIYYIIKSGATCHITPEISDFIPMSVVVMDKYILNFQMGILSQQKKRTGSNKNM